jgi:hypothetical protein
MEVDRMTMIEIRLPDELAQRAKSAGLLSDSAIQGLLEDAIRRQSGRLLLDVARSIHAANIPVMSDADIVAEVKAVRTEPAVLILTSCVSPCRRDDIFW